MLAEEGQSRETCLAAIAKRLETVCRHIDAEISDTHTADDLDKLLEQALYQTVILISDTAGMGKSTVLTHLSKQIKLDLNDHTDTFEAMK